MVLSYDVLKDRGTIDVVITEFFPRCFKMAEIFEKLDNISRDWAKAKFQKRLAEAFKQVREAGRRKTKPFPLENDSEKILDQSQLAVAGDLTKHKLVLVSQELLPYLEFNKPNKQDFLRLNYLKIQLFTVSK